MAECRHHGVSVLAASLPCPLQVRGDGLGWAGRADLWWLLLGLAALGLHH